jgi:hypothetical protein
MLKIKIYQRKCANKKCKVKFIPKFNNHVACSKSCEIIIKKHKQVSNNLLKRPISHFSQKRMILERTYKLLRLIFLAVNNKCAVNGTKANYIHHIQGRRGFYDAWAREKNIHLIVDVRFWLPVSMNGHRWIHEHIIEAKEKGFIK